MPRLPALVLALLLAAPPMGRPESERPELW